MPGKTVKVDYLARVEGETAIHVRIPGTGGASVQLKIFEPPRFFEGFLVGRRYDEIGDIVSRICGICPVSHMTTAIRALEKAMGVEPTEQARLLRRISSLSQIAASHLVHLHALAMPDYVGLDGVPEMLLSFPREVERFLRMRKVLNDLTALIGGGRALHPVGTVVGGFTRVPSRPDLSEVCGHLAALSGDAEETARMVASLPIPEFKRDREFVALKSSESYAVNVGTIVSSKGLNGSEDAYGDVFEEEQVPYAMAKRARVRGRGSLMVGALARVNLKYDQLSPRAKAVAGEVGLVVPDDNPFHNIIAKAIEVVHAIEECATALERLEPRQEAPALRVAAGEGGAATEAPRGLLYHFYAVNRNGIVERANIVTPTAHNFLCIEEDMKAMVDEIADRPPREIKRRCEMLVRAYDPCFSCSVH